MPRLFTFGCSFTKYTWPTWADLLGLEFDEFENWGVSGGGNVCTANRVIECIIKNNVNADDIVVVQWSTHLRHDYHTFEYLKDGPDKEAGWKTKGSIFNYLNVKKHDKTWLKNFFDEQSYVMHTLNAIHSTQLALESTGCNWVMTSLADIASLGSDISVDPGYNESSTKQGLWDLYPTFLPYKDKIWNDKFKWVDPIGPHCWKNLEDMYWWLDAGDTEKWCDPHPSLNLSIDWLYNRLKPALGLDNNNLTIEQKQWVVECKKLKEKFTGLDDFGEIVSRTLPNYIKSYKGY
jgi:hypothetical protein|tara:strand:- start:1282 stop:2154 length:873 start_codon:yes stop_codon:yes gene_type:complete